MKDLIVSPPLLTRGIKALLLSQFFSAFADNALLFVILAQLKAALYPDWSQPILQVVFVFTYIILAPFVGQIADCFAKGRVMLLANISKLIGAVGILLGLDPFLCYGLVGIGAAAYSPAKYGILAELTTGNNLVKANGFIEASTIAAILFGSVAGGFFADIDLLFALAMCVLFYVIAVVINLYIPRLAPAKNKQKWAFRQLILNFIGLFKTLWRDRGGRFSLIGTSLFWGAGVTLRFLLVLWVPIALNITDNTTPTLLNGVVAIGIIIGAGFAAHIITLNKVSRCMPVGIFIGVIIIILSMQQHLFSTYLILIILGVLGGLFIVPLNALLQEKGKQTIGAGNAVAIQNLSENTTMLIILGFYSLALKTGISIITIGIVFGITFAVAIGILWIWYLYRKMYEKGKWLK